MVLRKIAFMATFLPRELILSIERTRVSLTNGSTIEAFPNNPLTIRGPTLPTVYCHEMGMTDDLTNYQALQVTLMSDMLLQLLHAAPSHRSQERDTVGAGARLR